MDPHSARKQPGRRHRRRALPSYAGIGVASNCSGDTVGTVVKQPRQPSKTRPAPAPTKAAGRKKMFWRMKPNPELDRTGDWLLANLRAIRGKAPMTRVDPR